MTHPVDGILKQMLGGPEAMTADLRRQYDAFESWAWADCSFTVDGGLAHARQTSDLRRRIVLAYLEGLPEPTICRTVSTVVDEETLFPSPDYVRLVIEAHLDRQQGRGR